MLFDALQKTSANVPNNFIHYQIFFLIVYKTAALVYQIIDSLYGLVMLTQHTIPHYGNTTYQQVEQRCEREHREQHSYPSDVV